MRRRSTKRLGRRPQLRELRWSDAKVIGAGWRFAAEALGWAIAVAWTVRTRTLLQRIGEVPDLSQVPWDLGPTHAPGLIVVVPAKDEAETLRPAMETLLVQDYPWLRIVAVNDRSTDATGAILDELAQAHPDKLDVIHLDDMPEGWLGKTFALELATARSRSEYLLFTDADVWFSPSILRRAVAYAEMTQADHLVVAPTLVTKTWGERTVLGFLQVLALWATQPWRVVDSSARWNVAAAGAFNLVRREAFEEIGGWGPQRLAVVEDLTLGRRMRAADMRQRLVFAPGLVLVHWAPGAGGLLRGMSKNLFAIVNFWTLLMVFMMAGVVQLFLSPLAGLAWWPTLLPSLLSLGSIAVCYKVVGAITQVPPRYGWLYPLGALAMLWAMLRSMVVTWWRRGVLWRGTFYPLRELRAHNNPFTWEWEATRQRAERRKAERVASPSRWLRFARHVRLKDPGRLRPGSAHLTDRGRRGNELLDDNRR